MAGPIEKLTRLPSPIRHQLNKKVWVLCAAHPRLGNYPDIKERLHDELLQIFKQNYDWEEIENKIANLKIKISTAV